MTNNTISVSNEKLVFTTNKIIKVDEYRPPALVSKKSGHLIIKIIFLLFGTMITALSLIVFTKNT